MNDETLQDALDYCIANPEGLETEQLLGKFPELREELVPLLALCSLVSESAPRVPQDRYLAMKARVVSAAVARQQALAGSQNGLNGHDGAADGASIASTVPVVVAGQEPGADPTQPRQASRARAEERPRRRIFVLDWLKRPALAAAAFAAIMLAFVWTASASAMADSPLYRVRLLGESIAVNVQSSPEGKVLKHNELANIRLREIDSLEQEGKLAQSGPALDDYAAHLREGQEILAGAGLNEEQETRLAEALYLTCTLGGIELDSLNDDVANMPEPVRANVENTRGLQEQVRADTADVIASAENGSAASTLPDGVQEIVKQTPGPDATALATRVPQASNGNRSATPDDSGRATPGQGSQGGRATATAAQGNAGQATRTPTKTATHTATSTALATMTATQSAATATDTSISQATSTAAATSTSRPGNEATATPTPGAGEQHTATSTATEKPKQGATVTPPRGKPTDVPRATVTPPRGKPTELPQPSRTPGRPPTHTVKPDKEKTPEPTDTPVVPTATPVPPSATPTLPEPPSATPVEPTATRPATACDVQVTSVTIISLDCDNRNCLEWSATLTNFASEAVEVDWVAEVEAQGAGGFTKLGDMTGTTTAPPGDSGIGDTFCDLDIPSDSKWIRVIVRTDTGSASCDTRKQADTDPCETKAEPTKEAVPTKEAKPTEDRKPTEEPREPATPESKPTKPPRESPTEETEATVEPMWTEPPVPTREPKPTKEPKSTRTAGVLPPLPLPTVIPL